MDLSFLDKEVDIKIGGTSYPNTISRDIRIDRSNLNAEFLRQPEVYAYYASMEAIAKGRAAHLKWQRDIVYAQVDAQVRNQARVEMAQDKSIKYTEKMYESQVKTHPDYQAVMIELIEMEKLAGILGGFRNALEHKRTSLMSLGADDRIGAFDPKVLEAQAAEVKEKIAAKKNSQSEAEQVPELTKTSRRRPKKTA